MPCAAVRLCSAIDSPLPPICRRPSARESCCRLSGFLLRRPALSIPNEDADSYKGASDHERLQIRNPSASRRPGTGRFRNGFPCGPHLSNHFLCIPRFRPCRRSFRLVGCGQHLRPLDQFDPGCAGKTDSGSGRGRGCVGRRLGRRPPLRTSSRRLRRRAAISSPRTRFTAAPTICWRIRCPRTA